MGPRLVICVFLFGPHYDVFYIVVYIRIVWLFVLCVSLMLVTS